MTTALRVSSPDPDAAPERAVDLFLRYLEAEGVRVVFGIPGGLLHPFFEEVEHHPGLTLVVPKHEEGAAFMADGYARAGGGLAVCAGTAGPGSTNLLTGVSCAFADGVPMVVVTGQAASRALGRGAAQETTREDMDIVEMFRPVTKYSAMVTDVADLGRHLRRALRRALTGRQGPVHLNLPVDLWDQPVPADEWRDPATWRPETHLFDRAMVARAADALLDAEHPVILCGSGVAAAQAEGHLMALAELLDARVATTPRAKGVFPEDHPASLGVLGFAGHRAAREVVLGDEVDVLLTAGASLNETTTFNWHPGLRPARALLQLDIDPDRIGRNYPVDVPLVGDAQTVLVELVYHLHRAIRDGRRPRGRWREAEAVPTGEARYAEPDLRRSGDRPLTPQRWRVDLMSALPGDALVFSDIGGHMLFNLHDLEIRAGQRFLINLGFGSMGHGTVAPIGAALADPARPVVAIVGDGCFTMNGMELITAAEHELPVVWLVEHNDMHGITWHGSKRVGRKRPMESVRYRRHLDVSGIARAMGLATEVVAAPGELAEVLPRLLAARAPAVVEVRVDGTIEPPLGDRAKTIAGFTER